jgi:DNA-binding CsgD family transcriptional regulator
MNTALKIILRQREEDKKELEESILRNVNLLVLPYLEKIKISKSPADQSNYLRILESNLREVTSPFSTKLSRMLAGLTSTEIRVANLVKEGHTSKEISEMLHCSMNTVQAHRFNLRKKLQILGKGVNLRSYLGSIQ